MHLWLNRLNIVAAILFCATLISQPVLADQPSPSTAKAGDSPSNVARYLMKGLGGVSIGLGAVCLTGMAAVAIVSNGELDAAGRRYAIGGLALSGVLIGGGALLLSAADRPTGDQQVFNNHQSARDFRPNSLILSYQVPLSR